MMVICLIWIRWTVVTAEMVLTVAERTTVVVVAARR